MIDRDWIASRIPHQGGMCLLDGVESWDEENIVCITGTHARSDNPLRADATLGMANGIEYAAQAMAVHCALLVDEGAAPKSGYLTSVREVRWYRSRLDAAANPLRVCAHRLSGSDVNALYGFEIYVDELLLIEGRASVVLNAAELRPLSQQ